MPSQWLHLSYCSHWSRIRTQGAYAFYSAACLALRSCASEKPRKKRYGRVAVQHEIGDVLSHDACPPEGPKRSVLIVSGSCPSSTRNLETSSTKGVDPQTKIFGLLLGRKAGLGKQRFINSSATPHPPFRPFAAQRVDNTQIRTSARHHIEFLSIDDVFQTSG